MRLRIASVRGRISERATQDADILHADQQTKKLIRVRAHRVPSQVPR
ncbi:hypothetical protein DGo_PC0222 (plasmid) [Deinococcus gobiensis I-0]|uniref:Uncharacterized protein n=1 Tax=Deinococcus gobiensis (strain DSM 21396 / JCM 16679 / CGMCC 1.7299 / I-0) TaxID=745776 RepID=H8H3B7_DEIGI|nr:hypothetical protein DGo_PC0222 [Deinococcus gobiensis I-0]